MHLIYKNKGILVLPYFIASSTVSAVGVGALRRNYGGVFNNFDFYTTAGIAFLITAAWTYLTRDDYYRDRNGEKQKMDTPNEFYFISMKIWAYIFVALGLVFLGNSIFGYFGKADF